LREPRVSANGIAHSSMLLTTGPLPQVTWLSQSRRRRGHHPRSIRQRT
jgi:hypothetical protein